MSIIFCIAQARPYFFIVLINTDTGQGTAQPLQNTIAYLTATQSGKWLMGR